MKAAERSAESTQWAELLRQPDLTSGLPEADIYRAACLGAVMLLYEAGDADGLLDAVRHAAAPESRARALLALENLTAAPGSAAGRAVRLLHELAVLDGNPEAADFLRRRDLQDTDPGWNAARLLLFGRKHDLLKDIQNLEYLTHFFLHADQALCSRLLQLGEKVLPNWAILAAFLDEPSEENREKLLVGFASFSPDERKLLRFCLGFEPSVSSAAADLLLRYEDDALKKLCAENHLLPSDPSRHALYYFLSGQWEQYYASDSDYRSIRIAYEQKDPYLQRRLIAVSRDSGNSAWLREISGGSENQPHSGTLSDQHLLVRSLAEQKQWQRLWELLPNLPLLCMGSACRALSEAGFVPPQAEGKSFFGELCRRINDCRDLSPIPVRDRLLSNGGTAVGICGGGLYMAVLFSDRRILVWDKRSDIAEPIRISSNRLNFRRAVISPDGKYLCADCGSEGITIFSLPGGQAVKTFGAGSPQITGLYLQNDGRRLVTLDQKGTGVVYAFPGGTELKRFDLAVKDCSRSAYDSEHGRICGMTMEGACTVYDLAGYRPLNAISLGGSLLTAPELISNNRLPVLMRDETLSVVNLLSGKNVLDKMDLKDRGIRRIMPLAEGDLFALGTLDGQICIYDPYAGCCHAVLGFGSRSAVTGICYDAETNVLYGCNSAGTVRSWDMGLFREMIRVLPLMQLPGIRRIDEFSRKYPEPGVKAAAEWLKTVIAWRRRFDIELDFD